MNPPQSVEVPMATAREPNEETTELTRLFYQTKKALSILSYEDLTNGSIKLVLNTSVGYEPNHESSSFSIRGAKDVTASLINVSTAV